MNVKATVDCNFFSKDYIQAVNKTSQKAGIVTSIRAFCYRYLIDMLSTFKDTNISVLDYGCGKLGAETKYSLTKLFRELKVISYDIGINYQEEPCISDIVVVSNVINVQPSEEYVLEVIKHAWSLVEVGGLLIVNYPSKPRYSKLSSKSFQRILESLADLALLRKVNKPNHVWLLRKLG